MISGILSLPAAAASDRTVPTRADELTPTGMGPSRLLVLASSPNSRTAIDEALAEHVVEHAQDADGAISRLRAEIFHLFIFEVAERGTSAVSVLREIRADPGLSSLPIVLVLPGEENDHAALLDLADDYVRAPLRARDLQTRIRVQLELARARQRAAELTSNLDGEFARHITALERLHEVTLSVARAGSREEALRLLLAAAAEAAGADRALVSLAAPDRSHLVVGATCGFSPEFVRDLKTIPAGTGPCGTALVSRARVVIEDVMTDPTFVDFRPIAQAGGFRSSHSVPIVTRSNQILGVLTVHYVQWHRPTERETQLLDRYARMAADLLDHVRNHEGLRASEHHLDAMLALMPAGVYACDAQGRLTFFNRRAAELWGREPALNDDNDRFCGCLRAFTPEGVSIEPTATPMATALRDGCSYRDVEMLVEQPDGTRVAITINIDVLRSADGRVIGAINVFVDATARRRAEQELRESERRLRIATDTGKVGVWDWDIETNKITWTDSLYAMAGVPRGETPLSVDEFMELVHPDDRAPITEALRGALEDDLPYEVELRVIRRDGTISWLFSNATVLRNAAGKPVRMLGASVDITERKCIEIALHASEREAAERFRFMANSAPALVWQADTMENAVWFNERWLTFVGRAMGDVLGLGWMEDIHPEDREPYSSIYRNAFAARTEFEADFRLRRADGAYRWVLARGIPLTEADGTFTGYIGSCIDITERKRAEETVQRLAAIVESTDDAIIGQDLSGCVTSWNKGAEQIFGYTAEEVMGHPISVLIPEERRGEELKILQRLHEGHHVRHYETVRQRRDGSLIDVSLTISPIFDSEDRVIGMSKIARDVTPRKRHEAELRRQDLALRESESRFRILADNIAQLAWMADITGACFWFNQRWLDYTGFPAEQAIGWGWQKAHHPDYAERVNRRYQQQIAGGNVWEDTYLLRSKDGSYRWFLTRATPIRDESGQILRWLGTNTDITNWKNAQEALRASERQLRLVTDNAPVYLTQIDHQHRFKFANQTYARRYGREVHQIIGAHASEVVGRRAYESIRPHIETALRGERVEFEMEVPYELLGPRWMHAVYVPERNSEGEVMGLVAVLSDVTDRRNAEREIEIARDRAVAASRAKDDFLAALSHELRTPLNPVLLLASEAAEDMELPERVRADFATIRKNVELEARLIDDLLDLTRITRGKLPLDVRPHDIHSILQDAVSTVRAEMEQKGIVLRFELGARRTVVRGDAVRLQQLLWNLLRNAVKFTPEGGRITIRTSAAGRDRIAVAVSDTGIGLTQSEIGRIFDAFSQGDHAGGSGSHRFGGVGLGLAISRMLVEMHFGTISVHSEGRDRGSTFVVELPLAPESAESIDQAQPHQPPLAEPFTPPAIEPAHRGRILLVDDHEPTRSALAHLLTRRKFEVVTAGTAADAIAIANAGGIDYVVSDIGLPDASGYELMERLRKSHGLNGVALSGYGMEHDVARSQAAGFAAHLTKPVRIQMLDQALGLLTKPGSQR